MALNKKKKRRNSSPDPSETAAEHMPGTEGQTPEDADSSGQAQAGAFDAAVLAGESEAQAEAEKPSAAESDWDGTLLDNDALNDDVLNVEELLASFRKTAEEEDRTFRMAIDQAPPANADEPASGTEPKQAEEPKQADEPEAAEAQPEKEPEPAPEEPAKKNVQPEASAAEKLKAEEYLIDTPAYMGLEGNTPRRKRRKRHPHFFYYIAEAFRGMASHGFMSFAAVGIITACLLIMGTFSLIAVNVNSEINELMDNNEFLAYVDEDYTEEEARALQSLIEAVDNVSEVTFTTREEALESYVSDLEDSSLYEDLDAGSVLRDRFSVKVEDLSLIEETSDAVAEIEGIVKISIEIDVANGFVTLRNVVMMVALVLVAILFIISLFIISNTIKLATISRKDEIAVMRMVGATSRFIRWPFIYQGAILGLLGAGIAYGLQTALYVGVLNAIRVAGQNFIMDLLGWDELGLYVLAVFLIAGLLIGVCGSSMAIRKFLKV